MGRSGGDALGVRRGVFGRRRQAWLAAAVAVSLLVLVLVATAAVAGSRMLAQAEALREAEETTSRLANLVVAPLLGPAMNGDVARRDELARAISVRQREGAVEHVTAWQSDGTVVFSSDPSRVGRQLPPVPALSVAFDGTVTAGIREADACLEVYAPLVLPGGPVMAVEATFLNSLVEQRASTLSNQLIWLAVLPVLVLTCVQLPLVLALDRRVRRDELERLRLLERAMSASERERRTIASDLHDGVVQDLAGAGFVFSALRPSLPADVRRPYEAATATVRLAVDNLRRLMVDIYPPDLSGPGLASALDELAAQLRAHGLAVSAHVAAVQGISGTSAAAVYRVVQEGVRNVLAHAGARSVRIELAPAPGSMVRVRVVDDGVGLPDVIARPAEGHLGLVMLRDRIVDLGGRFVLLSPVAGGTELEAVLPLCPFSDAVAGSRRTFSTGSVR